MSGPDIVRVQERVAVTDRTADIVSVGYTFISSEGSHSHTPASIGALAAANNLSDVADVSTSRSTIGADSAFFPLPGYGLTVASGDPMTYLGSSTFGSGTVFMTRAWVPPDTALTTIYAAVGLGGQVYTPNAVPNQFRVYTASGTGVMSTADDSAIWSTSGWRGKALTTPIAAESTGRFVYIGLIIGGWDAIPLAVPNSPAFAALGWLHNTVSGSTTPRCTTIGGQSALPTDFTPSSFGSASLTCPLVGAA